MARMHSRRKGKSSSTRPHRTEVPEWIPLTSQQVEELVVKLYREGHPTTQIGIILRDQYGIPSIKLVSSKKIYKILEENNLLPRYPEDLTNLVRRSMRMRNHLADNKKDVYAKIRLRKVESKIHRLSKYYKKVGKLPKDWRYSPDQAAIMLR